MTRRSGSSKLRSRNGPGAEGFTTRRLFAATMAGIIGLRGPDIEKRGALRGYKVEFVDADRPIIRPHTGCPVLRIEDGMAHVARHVFGFTKKFTSFNARSDKLVDGKMWSRMFGKSHGVAPVSYILEWADMGEGKQPFRIERADGAAMAIPALVGHHWEEKDSYAFALVTVEPNDFVRTFHDRVVAQLSDDDIDVWLHPQDHDRDRLMACLRAGDNDELVAYPLKPGVGSAKFNDVSMLVRENPKSSARTPRATTFFATAAPAASAS